MLFPSPAGSPGYDCMHRSTPGVLGEPRPASRAVAPALKICLHDAVEFFDSRGGIKKGDEVASLMRRHFNQPIGLLARWIIERKVLSLRWHGDVLIPMFQFDLASMIVHAQVAMVVSELEPSWEDLRVTSWFMRSNPLLDGFTPFVALESEPLAVLQAAHATRASMSEPWRTGSPCA